MDITYGYMKTRSNFGRQAQFCEQGPEMCDSITVNPMEQKIFILRNPVHQPIQHTPKFSVHDVNTIRAEYTNTGANHAEGGWPRDINSLDPESTQRYRRKVEKDDGYIRCIMNVAPRMERYVLQNNAIEMYQTYYSEMPTTPVLDRVSCRTVNVYRDTKSNRYTKRPISSIAWQPDGHRFAVTYLDVDFNRNARSDMTAFIWDIEHNTVPDCSIVPPDALLDLQFSPRDKSVLAGGLMNGQVAMWDLRQALTSPVAMCPPHVAHRDLVRNVMFISAKSGMEFFSGGPDGVCKWWDMRKMDEPTEEMIMHMVKSINDVQSMAYSNGISVMEYEPTIPTRFMVGTENGLVIGGNRKGKTALDKLPVKFEAHDGPVFALERNPGFLKNFLTVGDWTARVWSEECRDSSIIMTPPQRHKITHGAWSPTRLSLIMLMQSDGCVALWDLLRRQHEPLLTMHLCDEPLLRVSMHEAGTLAACGNSVGNIYMVELSHTLARSDKNDKLMMTAILERESKRERILEARLREIRLKLRQAEEGSPAHSTTDLDMTLGDKDLIEATADYMAATKKEHAAM